MARPNGWISMRVPCPAVGSSSLRFTQKERSGCCILCREPAAEWYERDPKSQFKSGGLLDGCRGAYASAWNLTKNRVLLNFARGRETDWAIGCGGSSRDRVLREPRRQGFFLYRGTASNMLFAAEISGMGQRPIFCFWATRAG